MAVETVKPVARRSVTRSLLSPLLGVLYGLVYGLCARLAFGHKPGAPNLGAQVAFAALSVGFLFAVPLALGAIAIWFADLRGRWAWVGWVFLPWIPCLLLGGVVLALGWEGAICIVMALPILLAMGTLGGVIAGLALLQRQRAQAAPAVVALALLPFLVGPIEPRLPAPVEERIVENDVVIAADATTVWRHIVRVAAIQPQEQRQTFFHRIGIPQPREATLDHEGLGGVREASFHGGVLFRETIDAWEPERSLGFGIRVVPESIQDGVLDEHVRVGGAYFDVLYGRFEIEPLGPQLVRLHLSSRHRLSTRLNAYAGLWSSAVMHDLQVSICEVIKRRCEAAVAPPAARASTPDRATIPGL